MEILELNNIISEIKTWLDRLNSQMDMTEGRVHELENRAIESIQGEEQRKKKIEKNAQSISENGTSSNGL